MTGSNFSVKVYGRTHVGRRFTNAFGYGHGLCVPVSVGVCSHFDVKTDNGMVENSDCFRAN